MIFDKQLTAWISTPLSWKDAVVQAVDLLVKHNYAKPTLTNAIIKTIEQYGAYQVLEDGLVLLHAQAFESCLKPALSLVVTDTPIVFDKQHKKQARFIFCLSAPDPQSHIELMKQFAHYFGNDSFKQSLYQVKNLKQLFNLVESLEKLW